MSTTATIIAAAAIVIALATWLQRAHGRLVEHRDAVRRAFAGLHAELERRHLLTDNLIECARIVAADDPRMKVETIVATLDAARATTDFARFDPLDAQRVMVVDRAEVTLSSRLGRTIAKLRRSDLGDAREEVGRLLEAFDLGARLLEMATAEFNETVLTCNREARKLPARIVSAALRLQSPTVVSPSIADMRVTKRNTKPATRSGAEAADERSSMSSSATSGWETSGWATSGWATSTDVDIDLDLAPQRPHSASLPGDEHPGAQLEPGRRLRA